MTIRSNQARALVVSVTLLSFVGCSRPQSTAPKSWNAKAAAVYLDQREVAWMNCPGAASDRGTFYVSCHTFLPEVLSRLALRPPAAEQDSSQPRIVANVRYAMAFNTFVLGQADISSKDPTRERGLAWLAQNQNREGAWPSSSLVEKRDPSSMQGHCMSYAATADAVLAPTENRVPPKTESLDLQLVAQSTPRPTTGQER